MIIPTTFLVAISGVAAYAGAPYDFTPDNAAQPLDAGIPLSTNWTALQNVQGNSFWSSSFVTATNDRQYLILSHYLTVANFSGLWSGSILDIGNPSEYVTHSQAVTDTPFITSPNGRFDVEYSNFTYQALSDDSISVLQTTSITEAYTYNITHTTSSETLLNWGGNPWQWGNDPTTQWSSPRNRVEGTFSLNDGETLTIDPERSFTWYDRQIVNSTIVGLWTWFELHFPQDEIYASIWSIELPNNETERFATIKTPYGTHLTPYTLVEDEESRWTSEKTGKSYYSNWVLEFPSGDSLSVRQPALGQEMHLVSPTINRTEIEAFVVVEQATLLGQELSGGWGLVEIAAEET
ncbi:Kievitone hydratase [Cercospora beticola]|uniref:Kievitone hydratase n=1 Tax=Cercospora beticola TaxID=122368 RepID=A0A2G5HI86_CERBT|nr:Kievitone hydratase [Cercospora beticola]PIA92248.1 Kievitone hydratase [Cercospora beticola]WPB06209.1 hypothetical protein RHO25_010866 [Cercospora beticola]